MHGPLTRDCAADVGKLLCIHSFHLRGQYRSKAWPLTMNVGMTNAMFTHLGRNCSVRSSNMIEDSIQDGTIRSTLVHEGTLVWGVRVRVRIATKIWISSQLRDLSSGIYLRMRPPTIHSLPSDDFLRRDEIDHGIAEFTPTSKIWFYFVMNNWKIFLFCNIFINFESFEKETFSGFAMKTSQEKVAGYNLQSSNHPWSHCFCS